MPNWLFHLRQLSQQLWVRVALFVALGVTTSLAAVGLAPWIPDDLALTMGTGAVDQVLGILATSMLTVATFSLTTLVTAYTSIANTATPRAATLMISGGRGQTALATFVGAFIYAVVGIFALQTGYYGAQGRVIVFFVTLGVLAMVVLALLRWIDQLSKLGRVGEAIDEVADATSKAFGAALARRRITSAGESPGGVPVLSDRMGHVRNIDVDRLQMLAAEADLVLTLEALPGDFVHLQQPLFLFAGGHRVDGGTQDRLRRCWTLGDRRTFDQDPRFGLSVLGEIAAKALSPGINDPGTALDVIATATRVLTDHLRAQPHPMPPPDRLRYRALDPDQLLDDAFTPVARYGASSAAVMTSLLKSLHALGAVSDADFAAAVDRHLTVSLERALDQLTSEHDRRLVADAARQR